jgi:tetratricopeptide (TPR) repeat protein
MMARTTMTVSILAGSLLLAGAVPAVYGQAADVLQAIPVTQATVTQPAAAGQPAAPQPDYMLQGTMNFRLGNYEEALDDLTKARLKDPQSSVAAFYLGATLKKMQQYSKALPHLVEAVTLQPAVKEAYPELADVYYVLGKNDEALKALESAEREGVEPAQTAYLKGLVLIKKRSYTEGEASLEKARTLDPKLSSAVDYQIAMIYHRQGKQAEALDRFNAVAAKDPESDVGQMAKQQADALSKLLQARRQFSAVVSAQYQYDSNVILKPNNAPSAVAISNQSDNALVVTAQAEYAPVLPAPYSLKLQYALYASKYQKLTDYDVMSNTFAITPGMALGGGSLSAPLSYNMTTLNGNDYLKAFGLAPVYVFTPAEGQQAQAVVRYQQFDFQYPVTLPDENRDSTDIAMGISWYWLIAQQKGYLNARYEIDRNDATGKNWSYLGNKIDAAVLYPMGDALRLSLELEAYFQTYENVNTSFNVKRKDTTVTATAQALYALTRNVEAYLQYMYMKDDSNIDVYAFSKNVIGIGLYARF